jgi:hypothetical protein
MWRPERLNQPAEQKPQQNLNPNPTTTTPVILYSIQKTIGSIKDHNRHLFVRDGVTQQELDVAEDLFKKADREKATNARAIALLFMKLLKFVYFPVEIPKEYIETQADRVPYCSR